MATPKIVGVMLCRSESWAIGLSLRAAALWCDQVIVQRHVPPGEHAPGAPSSADEARIIEEVSQEFPGKIYAYTNAVEDWPEMAARQLTLAGDGLPGGILGARGLGATHVAIIDADEVLTANLQPVIRDAVLSAGPGECVGLPMVSTYGKITTRRYDGNYGERSNLTLGFGDRPDLHWANAADGYCYHARPPRNATNPPRMLRVGPNAGGVFHLQYVSEKRLKVKAVWYKMVETVKFPGRMAPTELDAKYDWAVRSWGQGDHFTIPEEWWADYRARGWLDKLDLDMDPWQLHDARRLMATHGPDKFKGLNLHGVL